MSTSNAYATDPTNVRDKTESQQPGYIQQVYQGATNLATSAATALQGALGSSTTDPTTGYRNQQPHVGGVGDLGTSSEADVARLPEERANPEPYTGSGVHDLTQPNPAFDNPIDTQTQYNQRDASTSFPQGSSGVSQGQNQYATQGSGYTSAGVGDLGTNSDSDVARLPEERANPDPLASAPGASRSVATGAAAGIAAAQELEDKDHWRQHKSYDQAIGDPAHVGHSGGMTGSNHDTDHGLGAPHREGINESGGRDAGAIAGNVSGTSGTYNSGSQFADSQTQSGQAEGRQFVERDMQDQAAQSSNDPTGQALADDKDDQKTGPSKFDQLKGRYHMAKGKITRDQEEIEQGKRLKETGKYVDLEQEIQEGKFDDVLDKKGEGQQTSNTQF